MGSQDLVERSFRSRSGFQLTKKCTIVLCLVEEAEEKPNDELKEEISLELQMILGRIPWAKEIEKITISTPRGKNKRTQPER